MTPFDALLAATSANADLLGISSVTGTLDRGKIADIIAMLAMPRPT